jgi:hypothetical protein
VVSDRPSRRPLGCFTIVGIVVVGQVAVVVLFRLGQVVGWPVPVGLVVMAGLWLWRRRRLREGR